MMHFLRHRQPALTRILPHQANSRFMKTRGRGVGGTPAFLVDFAGGSIVPIIGGVSGTFTRAGASATRVNAAGLIEISGNNVPRFDHDPVTRAPLGLLMEGARSNIAQQSETLTVAPWTPNAVVVAANTVAAPDGALSADTVAEDLVSAQHFIQQDGALAGSTPYTASFFLKAGAGTRHCYVYFIESTGGLIGLIVNPANGAITLGPSAVVPGWAAISATVKPFGNGWWRVCISATSAAGSVGYALRIGLSNDPMALNPVYTGDGVSAIVVWGVMLEAGAFASSYIPTVGVTILRQADFLSYPVAPWLNPAAGTIHVRGAIASLQQEAVLSDLYTDGSNRITLVGVAGPFFVCPYVEAGGVAQAILAPGVLAPYAVSNVAAAYAANDFAGSIDGGAVVSDSAGTVPAVNTLSIGGGFFGHQPYERISRFAYWPRRLSNAELVALSSGAA